MGTSWRAELNPLKRAMAIARILFPLPLPEPFDYAVPDDLQVQAGSYVRAPLGKIMRTGVVWEMADDSAGEGHELKAVEGVYPTPPMTEAMRRFIDFTARYTVASPGAVLAMTLRSRGGLQPSPTETLYELTQQRPARLTPAREKLIAAAAELGPTAGTTLANAAGVSAGVVKGLAEAGTLAATRVDIDAPYPAPDLGRSGKPLTEEQARAARDMVALIETGAFSPFLLDGVTGSGKTEVYFEAIAAALTRSETAQVLVMLPEIALTQAILSRFEERFGVAPAPWHSGLSDKQRRRTWRETAHGRARIVIGARSALFSPISRSRPHHRR